MSNYYIDRCPQWPCLHNCNKLTTGLSGVTSQITESHQTQLKQCIVTAHWPTNGLQRLILRITSQQLIMFCHQARTHAHTHSHTVIIYIYYYTVGLNIMYRPTFKKNTPSARTTLGPSFYFVDPVFFKPVGSQDPCFLCPSSNTVIYN